MRMAVSTEPFQNPAGDLDGTLTLNSTSSDGSGTTTIADASNLTLNDGSTLAIEGNQDVILGVNTADTTDASNRLDIANDVAGSSATVDASNFSGDLTANLLRAADGTSNAQTVQLGSGDDTIGVTSAAAGTDDTFNFVFSGSDIGDDRIEAANTTNNPGFDSATGGTTDVDGFVDDELTFDQISGTPGNFTNISGDTNGDTGTITDGNGNDVLSLELVNGGNDTLIEAGADASFSGSVTLVGVGDLGALDAANFNFTG